MMPKNATSVRREGESARYKRTHRRRYCSCVSQGDPRLRHRLKPSQPDHRDCRRTASWRKSSALFVARKHAIARSSLFRIGIARERVGAIEGVVASHASTPIISLCACRIHRSSAASGACFGYPSCAAKRIGRKPSMRNRSFRRQRGARRSPPSSGRRGLHRVIPAAVTPSPAYCGGGGRRLSRSFIAGETSEWW
jgi:hypothetical protein